MQLVGKPLTAALVLASAAGSVSACSGYDAPLPPRPAVVVAQKTPPAISGGTLIVSDDRAYASDPDRDRVLLVDLSSKKVIAEVALEAGDEPGRLVETNGQLFVSLRSGAAVAMIDIAGAKLVKRLPVCAYPRGLAVDSGKVHVACAGGDLVTLDAADGSELSRVRLESDLRDIVVEEEGTLLVSRFRNAEVIRVDTDGIALGAKVRFAPAMDFSGRSFEPEVAYRMVGVPGGGALVVHQRATTTPVQIQVPNGYGGGVGDGCDNSIVHGTVGYVPSTSFDPNVAPMMSSTIPGNILPVDLAYAGDASFGTVAVVTAGSNRVVIGSKSDFDMGDTCGGTAMQPHDIPDGPIAVAFSQARQDFVVQTREPARLVVANTGEVLVELGGESVFDTGHAMFHTNPGGASSLACASCHPEGRDDGRVWNFDPIGARRTPTLGGGIVTTTAPLHWDGDMTEGLDTIMTEVFVNRMGGNQNSPRRIDAFGAWLDKLPAFRPIEPADSDAVARGEALFQDAGVGCASCHKGELYTNNETVDVGTGRAFQVPPLVGLGSRAPYMHDGCAPTLRDRFANDLTRVDGTVCGGNRHGNVEQLDAGQIDDLIAYLETL